MKEIIRIIQKVPATGYMAPKYRYKKCDMRGSVTGDKNVTCHR